MRGGAYLLKWNPVYATSRATRPASSSPNSVSILPALRSVTMPSFTVQKFPLAARSLG